MKDATAAIELLKEEFQAEARGHTPIGLVYSTSGEIPEEFWSTLGITKLD